MELLNGGEADIDKVEATVGEVVQSIFKLNEHQSTETNATITTDRNNNNNGDVEPSKQSISNSNNQSTKTSPDQVGVCVKMIASLRTEHGVEENTVMIEHQKSDSESQSQLASTNQIQELPTDDDEGVGNVRQENIHNVCVDHGELKPDQNLIHNNNCDQDGSGLSLEHSDILSVASENNNPDDSKNEANIPNTDMKITINEQIDQGEDKTVTTITDIDNPNKDVFVSVEKSTDGPNTDPVPNRPPPPKWDASKRAIYHPMWSSDNQYRTHEEKQNKTSTINPLQNIWKHLRRSLTYKKENKKSGTTRRRASITTSSVSSGLPPPKPPPFSSPPPPRPAAYDPNRRSEINKMTEDSFKSNGSTTEENQQVSSSEYVVVAQQSSTMYQSVLPSTTTADTNTTNKSTDVDTDSVIYANQPSAHYNSTDEFGSRSVGPASDTYELWGFMAKNYDHTKSEFDENNQTEDNRYNSTDLKRNSYKNSRSQTLSDFDYPARLRQRILSFRENPAIGTLRNNNRTSRNRYVQSEVYKWPFKIPKFRRNKDSAPKQILTKQDYVISRPKLQMLPTYQLPSYAAQNNDEQIPPVVDRSKFSQYCSMRPMSENTSNSQTRGMGTLPEQVASLLDLCSRQPVSDPKGMIQIVMNNPSSNLQQSTFTIIQYSPQCASITDSDKLILPYFNRHSERTLFATINTLSISDNFILKTVVHKTAMELHPFLPRLETDHQKFDSNAKASITDEFWCQCLQDYISDCMKLQSTDLRGEYAAFHYPLKGFDDKLWLNCGHLKSWEELKLIHQNKSKDEYVVLPINSKFVCYPTKTVDTILMNWVETKPDVDRSNQQVDAIVNEVEAKLLHSTIMILNFDCLLQSFNTVSSTPNDFIINIYIKCVKLALLLSLNECMKKQTDFQFDFKSENILVICTPTNYLFVFKKLADSSTNINNNNLEDDYNLSEYETITNLLRMLSIEGDTIEESINLLIGEIATFIKDEIHCPDLVKCLFKAVVPPDWIGMTLARVCLNRISNNAEN